MVLIITSALTDRLKYICHLIFKEQLGMAYRFSNNLQEEAQAGEITLHYHQQTVADHQLQIHPHPLLFEKGIHYQSIELFQFKSISDTGKSFPAFFKTAAQAFSFDIFAASFYLLSRYEEYQSNETDEYGRFPHIASVAYKNQFLTLPLVNIWIAELAAWMKSIYPTIPIQTPTFESVVTYDIDMAWSYRNKGLWRNLAGWLRHPNFHRIKTLIGKSLDPFDCFDYITESEKCLTQKSILFFLMAANRGRYDKNTSPSHPNMQQLIGKMAGNFHIAWHPSWKSYGKKELLEKEKQSLESILNNEVVRSRQHYIRMHLPETYQQLLQLGIKKEYSLGYGSINGFRASFAGSFLWYDLYNEQITDLRIYPFCFMDANSRFEQKQNVAETINEVNHYLQICRDYNGLFISIFHNHLIGNDQQGLTWRTVHQHLISQLL